MNRSIILLSFAFTALALKAQFFKGDAVINFNYGAPNLIAHYYISETNKHYQEGFLNYYSKSFSNSGVYSAKIEYAITDKLSLGIYGGYWNMTASITSTFSEHIMAYSGPRHIEHYDFKVSSLSVGIRCNYRMWPESKNFDPYIGAGLGLTNNGLTVTSDQSLTPAKKFPKGIGPCIALTVGTRYYPVPFFGFNLEAGYDTGALILAGVVFKINTKNAQDIRKNRNK